MSDFNYDLKVGHGFEDSFVNHYKPYYTVTTTQKKGKFNDYDAEVFFDDGTMKVELKWDRMAHNTGNHAVELYKKFRGDDNVYPGGLSATKADVYVFGFEGFPEVYGMETWKLMQLVEDKKYKKIVDYTGDGNASIALFDLKWFLGQCEYLYTTKQEQNGTE